ncbi:nuclear transcription factor Y subunit B-1-like [Apium graveolens]|uniref:nuclear transcription factor Y subunit B-1-like n=1 Tax=Apium graveolens TaxID=4045 RepID=UPI003D7A485E
MTGKRKQTSPVGSPSSGNISDGSSKDQDKFLPIANVSRIMKKSLPANAKISKEAKETVQECVSEFISFITGEASDKCQREKRKTINGDDLLWAMTTLGFENYVGTLKIYLNKYREVEDKNGMATTNSPTNTTSSVSEFNTATTSRPDFNTYYSLGEQVHEKSYGENMMMNINGGFSIADRNGNGGIIANPPIHHGVEW